MIQVKQLSKQYTLNKKQRKKRHTKDKSLFAVRNATFTCNPGKVFALLGPNGAGKTTLLRMIATILKPTAGEIVVAGKNTAQYPADVRRSVGFLTGSTKLYNRLTAEEVVSYFAQLYRVDKEHFLERKKMLFDQLGIHAFSKKRIGQLSTGMKQKVSIARSMIHDPDVIIFDEPTQGLDVITAHSIIELIRQCKQAGKTVIFSSHIMSEVDLLCDDLAIIHEGNIIYTNTMKEFRILSGEAPLTETFIKLVQKCRVPANAN